VDVQKVTEEGSAVDKENCGFINQVSAPALNFMASTGCDAGTIITQELFKVFLSSALTMRRRTIVKICS